MSSPTAEDPLARIASEVIGGPRGSHASPHRWWTPLRVVLALAAVGFSLAMLQKAPCAGDDWNASANLRFGAACYSDLPFAYHRTGLAERHAPFVTPSEEGRFADLEQPILVEGFAYGTALLTHAVEGWPDLEARQALPPGEAYADPGVREETSTFVALTAILLLPFALLTAWFLVGAAGSRPFAAALAVVSPSLVLTGLIGWELIGVTAIAGALWAWSRGRVQLTGVFAGLAVSAGLPAVVLLVALTVVMLRDRRAAELASCLTAALLTWVALAAPALVVGRDQWLAAWVAEVGRGPELGSAWFLLAPDTSPRAALLGALVLFALWSVGVALVVRRTPLGLAQVALLIGVGYHVVALGYSPQQVLWLLPLAALAAPRWRDVGIWQAGEVVYFFAVWWHLGGFTAPSTTGGEDVVYAFAIVVRIAAELYLAVRVIQGSGPGLRPGLAASGRFGSFSPVSGRSKTD